MPERYKPMLAAKTDEAKLDKFLKTGKTVMASAKYDGIRCTVAAGVAYSRSKKVLANRHLQKLVSCGMYDGLDGEIIVGPPNLGTTYNTTERAVKAHDRVEDFKFYVFDQVELADKGVPFKERYAILCEEYQDDPFVTVVPHVELTNLQAVLDKEVEVLAEGFEGLMVRRSDGLTKFGRSTANEMLLMKIKRDEDTELEVVGFEEAMHNENAEFVNELGNIDRSSHKENLTPTGRVGAFLAVWEGKPLKIATGKFTHEELEEIWNNQQSYVGQLLKFRYFPHGMKDLPRHPRALGWRDKIDT